MKTINKYRIDYSTGQIYIYMATGSYWFFNKTHNFTKKELSKMAKEKIIIDEE